VLRYQLAVQNQLTVTRQCSAAADTNADATATSSQQLLGEGLPLNELLILYSCATTRAKIQKAASSSLWNMFRFRLIKQEAL